MLTLRNDVIVFIGCLYKPTLCYVFVDVYSSVYSSVYTTFKTVVKTSY